MKFPFSSLAGKQDFSFVQAATSIKDFRQFRFAKQFTLRNEIPAVPWQAPPTCDGSRTKTPSDRISGKLSEQGCQFTRFEFRFAKQNTLRNEIPRATGGHVD